MYARFSFLAVAALAAATTVVHAWGAQGHQLTGGLAQRLMDQTTASLVTALLPDEGNDMAQASTWADRVKFHKGYGWSRELHFVDSKDSPPHSCGFQQQRDCKNGKCLTGAIANFTTQLGCDRDASTRGDATKFLIHFLGDLTQPLHTCARLRGGNEAHITFGGKTSVHSDSAMNLHGIWDYSMITKIISTQYNNDQSAYLDHLYSVATSSDLASDVASWTACLSASSSSAMDCAMSWASDSDAINCQGVWGAYDSDPKQDFAGQYFDTMWPVLERQLIKAGVRMAAFFPQYLTQCNQ